MTLEQRKFRFGVSVSRATSLADWKAKARKAESSGYDVFLMPDHFGGQIAIGPALAVVAESTHRIRIGTLVWQNDLRHPAILANEAASLDLLSEGRLEPGIGAGGSFMPDFDWTGITLDSPGNRVSRVEESITILKKCFADGPFSFQGNHYQFTDFDAMPKPVQKPHPPLLVGAGGPRMLAIAARQADIIGILPGMLPRGATFRNDEISAAATQRKIDLVRSAAPDRFARIEFNVLVQALIVTDNRDKEIDRLTPEWEVDAESIRTSPLMLIGTEAEIADQICFHRDHSGISYFTVFEHMMDAFEPIMSSLAGT